MKVFIKREGDTESWSTTVEITDCSAVEAVAVIDAVFNPICEEDTVDIPAELIH